MLETAIGLNGPINVDAQPGEFLEAHGMHAGGDVSPEQARMAITEGLRHVQRTFSNSSQKTYATTFTVVDENAPPSRRYTRVSMNPNMLKTGEIGARPGFVAKPTINTDRR